MKIHHNMIGFRTDHDFLKLSFINDIKFSLVKVFILKNEIFLKVSFLIFISYVEIIS